jgi:hypothetical protein
LRFRVAERIENLVTLYGNESSPEIDLFRGLIAAILFTGVQEKP